MKKQLITVFLAGFLVFSVIPEVTKAEQTFEKGILNNVGMYSKDIENATALIKGVSVFNDTEIQVAGFKKEEDNSVFETGNLILTDENEIYLYISSILALKITGIDTYTESKLPEGTLTRYSYVKEEPDYTIPDNLECGYGNAVNTVMLPSRFKWESNDIMDHVDSSSDPSDYSTYKVSYIPDNPLKYLTKTGLDIKVKGIINTVTSLSIPVLQPVAYSGNQTLADIPLPKGWVWDDPSIVPSCNVTAYSATYKPSPSEYYDLSKLETTTVDIPLSVILTDCANKYEVRVGRGWNLYSIPLPSHSRGVYSYIDNDISYPAVGTYHATIQFTPDTAGSMPVRIPMTITVTDDLTAFTMPNDLTVGYGQLLKDIALPSGWAWEDGNKSAGNVGSNYFRAVFTDGVNTITRFLQVSVLKASAPDIKKPSNIEIEWIEDIKLTDIKLPDGWSFNKGQSLKMGENFYTVSYTASKEEMNNYDFTDTNINAGIIIKLTKATPIYKNPSAIKVKKGVKLTDDLLPSSEYGKYTWMEKYTADSEGTYKCSFIPTDNEHYKTIKNIGVKVFFKDKASDSDADDTIKDTDNTVNNDTTNETYDIINNTYDTNADDTNADDTARYTDKTDKSSTKSSKPRKKGNHTLENKIAVPVDKPKPLQNIKLDTQKKLQNIFAKDITIGGKNNTGSVTVSNTSTATDTSTDTSTTSTATEYAAADANVTASDIADSITDATEEASESMDSDVTSKNIHKPDKRQIIIGVIFILIGIGAWVLAITRKIKRK